MPKLDLRQIEKRVAKLEGGHKLPVQRIVVVFGDDRISLIVGTQTGSKKSKINTMET